MPMFEKIKDSILDFKTQQELFMAFARGEEISLTPARIFQVFYKDHFNIFLNKHPEMGVGIAAVVASLYGAIHVCRKYFQWRESNDQLNVNRLFDCLDNFDHINIYRYSEFKEQRKGEFLNDLKKIPGFKNYTFDIKGGSLCIIEEKLQNTKIKVQESNKLRCLINDCRKSSIYKLWVRPIWTAFGVYSMTYWWLFMLTTLIFAASGAAASNILLFGIPMLLPAIMLFCHLGKNVYQYFDKDAEEKKRDKKDNKRKKGICRNALLAYFLQEYLFIKEVELVRANLNRNDVIKNRAHILINNYNSAINLSKVTDGDVDAEVAEIKKEAIGKNLSLKEKIKKERLLKITIGAMTGFVAGYCVGVFNQWPILDFLSKVVGVSSVASPHAIIITFAISVAIGLIYAFLFALGADGLHHNLENQIASHEKKYPKENEKELTYNVNEYISIQQAKISGFKEKIFERQKKLDKAVFEYNLAVKDRNLKIDPSLFKFTVNNYVEMQTNEFYKKRKEYSIGFMYVKKTLNRAAAFLAGAGTGMFLVRSLFMSGCIIALFCPLSLSAILSMACAMALVWGCVKLAEYHVNSIQDREKQLLDQADIRAETLAGMSNVYEKQLIEMANYTAKINEMARQVKNYKQMNNLQSFSPLFGFQEQVTEVQESSQFSASVPLPSFS